MHPADSDSDSAGARRLAALLDVERAVADASASATATIEQLSTALQRAGDAGLPELCTMLLDYYWYTLDASAMSK